MKKRIGSKFAISVVMGVAVIVCGFILWVSKNIQSDIERKQYEFSATICGHPGYQDSDVIVFLGDSITQAQDWNTLLQYRCIINFGVAGNTTDDIEARLDLVMATKPKKIFLMMGINDLLRWKEIPSILENYKEVLDRIHEGLPDTVVYIESILPVNKDVSRIGFVESAKIIQINEKLKLFSNGSTVLFIDLYPFFCGSDHKLYRQYSNDGVHLTSAGYAVWRDVISWYIQGSS